jgi:hypothetical protein
VGYSYGPLFVLVTDGADLCVPPFAAAFRYDAFILRGWILEVVCGGGPDQASLTFRRGRFLSRNQVSGRSMRGRVD